MEALPPPAPTSPDDQVDPGRIRPSLLWVIVPGILTAVGLGLSIASGIVSVAVESTTTTTDDGDVLTTAALSLGSWAGTLLGGAALALIIGLRHRNRQRLIAAARAERLAQIRSGVAPGATG